MMSIRRILLAPLLHSPMRNRAPKGFEGVSLARSSTMSTVALTERPALRLAFFLQALYGYKA